MPERDARNAPLVDGRSRRRPRAVVAAARNDVARARVLQELARAHRAEVLERAEERERSAPGDATCRESLRAGIQATLDTECRNWPLLMDFEVRGLVERVIDRCTAPGD